MSSEIIDLNAPLFNEEGAQKRREKYLTHNHTVQQKMELYNSSTKGKLEDLKECAFTKKYSLLEEVSKAGYYWNILHYASHFGHADIVQFAIDYFANHADRFEIFNMQTVEGKTPIFCAITSGDINTEKKKEIVKLWFNTSLVDLSLRKKTGEDLLALAKKNSLYDFIVESCLRED